jgi:MipA family protein
MNGGDVVKGAQRKRGMLVVPAMRALIYPLFLLGACVMAGPAPAQESAGWTVTIGGGAQVYPRYPGASGSDLFPLPIIDVRRAGRPMPFEAPDEGWGFGLLGDRSEVDLGPAIRFQNKRREDDVGAPVGNVGFTVEAGGFVQAYVTPNLRLRAEGRKGLGGHEGWVGDLSADLVLRDADRYIFSIGPRARLSDGRYQNAYFGVTPAVSAATGLPAFDAGGGFHAVGLTAGLTYRLARDWGLYSYAGYDRLIGNGADSPLVRAFGSCDQFSAGLGIFYSFDIGARRSPPTRGTGDSR